MWVQHYTTRGPSSRPSSAREIYTTSAIRQRIGFTTELKTQRSRGVELLVQFYSLSFELDYHLDQPRRLLFVGLRAFFRPGSSTKILGPFTFSSSLGCRSMFLVPTPQSTQHHALVSNCASLPRALQQQLKSSSPGAKLGKLLNSSDSPMERNVHDYSQSGLPSPYPSVSGDNQSEASSADHASAAQYPNNQEARPASYSASATPNSEYSNYPQSARSTSSFPEHSLRQYHPASNHNGSSGGMAQQTTTSPSMPMQDGRNHQPQQVKSDSDVPIDPTIAAPSPTYPHGQYSPYAPPPQDMAHSYPQGAPAGMYTQPRPDWANYAHPAAGQMPHHPVPYSHPPTSAPPGRPAQVGEDSCTLSMRLESFGILFGDGMLHFWEGTEYSLTFHLFFSTATAV